MREGYLLASEVILLVGWRSVEKIRHQGMSDMRHVNTYLVGSTGQQMKLAEAVVFPFLDNRIFCDRPLSVLTNRALDIAFLHSLDRCVNAIAKWQQRESVPIDRQKEYYGITFFRNGRGGRNPCGVLRL